MSRRIINRVSDSLQVEKQKAAEAKALVTTAKDEVRAIEQVAAEMQARLQELTAELKSIEGKYNTERDTLASLYADITTKRAEVRSVDGELADVLSKVAEAKAELQSLVSESAKETERLSKDHQDAMAAYAVTQSAARKAIEDAGVSLKEITEKIVAEKKVLEVVQRETLAHGKVGAELTKARAELENISHQVLVKQVELKNTESAILEAVAKTNAEKHAYDEAVALRMAEEERIGVQLKQLFDKEAEVETKARSLRLIQQGVDQATARLNRKEEELTLREHLSKKSEVTIT